MSNVTQLVNALRRPRLLLQAVKHGLIDYDRNRTLRRLLRSPVLPEPRAAAAALLLTEEFMETARLNGDASYSAARHIEVLVALIAEAREIAAQAAREDRAAQAAPPLRAASSG